MTKTTSLVRLLPLLAPLPSLKDNTGDLDRLLRAIRLLPGFATCPLVIPYRRQAILAASFRRCDFRGVALLNELALPIDERSGGCQGSGAETGTELSSWQLVDFLPTMPARLPALALDLGTTHLEAALIDLLSGQELARATRLNSQIIHGVDILSRIHFATAKDEDGVEGLASLQGAVIADINALAEQVAGSAGLSPGEIRALSVAGNTTMGHLFLGFSPYHLCREPYIPVVNAPAPVAAAQLGLAIHPAAIVHILPGVGSYFGGDLLAGIVACDLDLAVKPAMLIDVGTNAEVVVGCRDWLLACAGAAGPALEGGVAKMGMRAEVGVIERVSIDPTSAELSFTVIAENGAKARAKGICGSGMIDLMAELFLAGMIDVRGKFQPQRMGARLVAGGDGPALVVAWPEEAAGGEAVVVSQLDLEALIRSKAAMYAILSTLMDQLGLPFSALSKIYVAGAFGRRIAPRQAVVLGMIPDLPLATYQPVGNSSLAGACRYLLTLAVRERVRAAAKKITYLELNVNHEFMTRFSGALFIPHTDRSLFPSVPLVKDGSKEL